MEVKGVAAAALDGDFDRRGGEEGDLEKRDEEDGELRLGSLGGQNHLIQLKINNE